MGGRGGERGKEERRGGGGEMAPSFEWSRHRPSRGGRGAERRRRRRRHLAEAGLAGGRGRRRRRRGPPPRARLAPRPGPMPPVRRQVQSGRTGAISHEIKKSRQESRPWPIRAAVCRVSYAARKGKQIDLKDWRTIAANLGRSDTAPCEKSRRGQQANIKYIVVQVPTSRDTTIATVQT